MRLLFYDLLDSTMDEARRQLKIGEASQPACTPYPLQHEEQLATDDKTHHHPLLLPFGVSCRQQKKGYGQQDQTGERRPWYSPSGNMYLTLVFPTQVPPYFSLEVGLVLTKILKDDLGFSPTLKWPNDLLIDGKKLGGILMESTTISLSEQQVPCTLIGIGINLKSSDQLQLLGATSLEDWHVCWQPNQLAKKIALSFSGIIGTAHHRSNVSQLPNDVMKTLMTHLPSLGLLMKYSNNQKPQYALWSGLNSSGHMVVRPLIPPTLLATQNRDQFIYHVSSHDAPEFCFLDDHHGYCGWLEAGHTHLKAMIDGRSVEKLNQGMSWLLSDILVSSSPTQDTKQVNSTWLSDFTHWVGQFVPPTKDSPWPIYLGATGDQQVRHLLYHALGSLPGYMCVMIEKKTHKLTLSKEVFQTMGFDRICLLESVLSDVYAAQGSTWFMAISFGTAITIDFCRVGGEFLGGAILAGDYLTGRSLHQNIPALPHVNLQETPETEELLKPGFSTKKAVAVGIKSKTLGAISLLWSEVNRSEKKLGHSHLNTIFISGGGRHYYQDTISSVLTTELPSHNMVINDRHNVLTGLKILAMNSSKLTK
ncbi:MAG: type III pantothenate kinase [Proteobacteria bacterium]|nr:type III pantothenate kinase [Pseudomonadota bacterium]